QRLAGGNVQVNDVVVGDVVEVLDEGPQAVAVRRDQHAAPRTDGGRDGFVPERQHARDRVFQALGGRQQGRGDLRIAAVEARMALVGIGKRIGGDGIRTADRKSTRLNSSHVKISYAV